MYPDEWERFLLDPYAHRAPRAESYHDLSGERRPLRTSAVSSLQSGSNRVSSNSSGSGMTS